jgi:hypothetical protein
MPHDTTKKRQLYVSHVQTTKDYAVTGVISESILQKLYKSDVCYGRI